MKPSWMQISQMSILIMTLMLTSCRGATEMQAMPSAAMLYAAHAKRRLLLLQ
jgi:hypothetical protein